MHMRQLSTFIVLTLIHNIASATPLPGPKSRTIGRDISPQNWKVTRSHYSTLKNDPKQYRCVHTIPGRRGDPSNRPVADLYKAGPADDPSPQKMASVQSIRRLFMPENTAAMFFDQDQDIDVIFLGFRREEGENIISTEDNLKPCIWPIAEGKGDGGAYFIERVKNVMWHRLPRPMGLHIRDMNMESWGNLEKQTQDVLLTSWSSGLQLPES